MNPTCHLPLRPSLPSREEHRLVFLTQCPWCQRFKIPGISAWTHVPNYLLPENVRAIPSTCPDCAGQSSIVNRQS